VASQVALGGPYGPRDGRQRAILEAASALAGTLAGGHAWHGGTDHGGQLPGVAADVPKAGGSGCGACRWMRRGCGV
jgi:hypothetical protein